MGYRDEFYISQNIIGYTGSPQNNPTVYFDDNVHYGSITQFHDDVDAIGRSILKLSAEHTLLNYSADMEDGTTSELPLLERTRQLGAMFEHQFGVVTHLSRNPFVPIKEGNSSLRAFLSIAIERFQNVKRNSFQTLIEIHDEMKDSHCSSGKLRLRLNLHGHTTFYSLEQEIRYICQVEGLTYPPPRYVITPIEF